MKLELKHLKGYLGTNLKCHIAGEYTADTEFDEKPAPQVFEIVGLNSVFVEIYEEDRTVTEEIYYCDVFPILRPLSDLTEQIWNDIFVSNDIDNILSIYQSDKSLDCVEFYLVNLLLKHHFDIHGLIKKDLAIDINTL